MCWGNDLFYKNDYRPVAKDHCPSCSSKTRKSLSMTTLVNRKEHLFKEDLLVASTYVCFSKVCIKFYKGSWVQH